jgi:hypothetical protein
MTDSPPAVDGEPVFPLARWAPRLPALSRQYRENRPFPHIHLPGFLDDGLADRLAAEFPPVESAAWTHYRHHNENKHGLSRRERFPPLLGAAADALNAPEFVGWLSTLTGIPGLVADRSFEGGGLHQSGRGGFLNVHTDFSAHHYQKDWRRRVNLILYLNPGWREEWGGAIECWDTSMRGCVAKYPPFGNHAVIFTTDDRSLHGFPDPLTCPEGVTRKSLALYYYTVEREGRLVPRSTDYRARRGDGPREAALIWLDKKAVDLYSRAKARFKFSDDLASRILGFLSRPKRR